MRSHFFKKIIIITTLLNFNFIQPCLSQEKSDFRKTKWGMTKKEVKLAEVSEFIQERIEKLIYTTALKGLNAVIMYNFIEEKLVESAYMFVDKHSNKNDYISDYLMLKKILTKKYGKTKFEATKWRNDLYKSDNQHWGTAVSLGHLAYFAKWETTSSDIFLSLAGENFETSLSIQYTSNKFKTLIEEEKEKKELEPF